MAYQYLVYKLYKLALGLEYDNTPKFTALVSVSGLFFFNLATICNILNYFGIVPSVFQNLYSSITSAIIILVLNIILVNRIGLDNMGKQFLKKNEKRNDIFVVVYIMSSFVLYVVSFTLTKVQ